MSANEVEKNEAVAEDPTTIGQAGPPVRRFLTARKLLIAAGIITVFVLLLLGVAAILFKAGAVDTYTKNQFTAKLADIGVTFSADVFSLSVSPLELELKNATFTDKATGERLFFIRDGHLGMTMVDLLALRLSRDISIDSTEINGAEVWVKFDENGRSNFSNLHLVEDEAGSAVNFKYDSVNFKLQDSVVHFGDISRSISADAKNVLFLLSPETVTVTGDPKRYKFDLTSTDSNFVYDSKNLEKIDIRATGIADSTGAEISSFDLKTPVGDSTLSGKLTDWADPKYEFDIQSSLDLTQASSILTNDTTVTGVGNFAGKVTGHGENYQITGNVDSAGLRVGGVYLKALNVGATVASTNANYEADGSLIAEMLTFEDFRVDFLKAVGNIRGTGTDFRWVGELQAVAAKSKAMTVGGLYLSDALAEYKDKQFRAQAGNGRAQRFAIGDTEFAGLTTRDLKFSVDGDTVNLSASNGQARSLATKDYSLQGVTAKNLRVKNRQGETQVDMDGVRSETAEVKKNKIKNLSVDEFRFRDLPNSTEVTAKNLRADQVDLNGTRISGLDAPSLDLKDTAAGTVVYADKLRVAKVDAGSAILGSLNIGGVRLTIRQGRIEARSDDIDAGNVSVAKSSTLPGGGMIEGVKIYKPIYVLEPSGRYRATADMSLGGGAIGSVSLGAATAKVDLDNDRVAVNDLTASIMNGRFDGRASIAMNDRAQSTFNGVFSELDISRLLALQGGRIIPIEGQTTGRVDLTFTGSNVRGASGSLNAQIVANAGTADRGLVPVNGQLKVTGVNGLFNVDLADLSSANSKLTASGRFDLRNQNSNLMVALRSTEASEVDRLIRVLGVSPDLEHQLDSMQVQLAGNLNFDGNITGNLSDPTVDGKASLDSLIMRGREVGSIASDIFVSPTGVDLRNGRLQDRSGGNAMFTVSVPYGGTNNIAIKATLSSINVGNLLAALPVDLPGQISDLSGSTSGTIDVGGLPNAAKGEVNLAAAKGTLAGQSFDNLVVKAVFSGTLIDLQQGEMQIGTGRLTAGGNYDRSSGVFDLNLAGKTIPTSLLLALLPKNENIPVIAGDVDFTAKAAGAYDRASTYNLNFEGSAPNVIVGETAIGRVVFNGNTTDQKLTANLTADLGGRPQLINARVDLGDENLPFMVATDFNQSPLAPFVAFVPQLRDVPVTGTGTGHVEFGGNLSQIDGSGTRIFSADGLHGKAEFTQLGLQIQDTPLAAAEPILITFNTKEIVFEKARFAGGGSNMSIAGTKALTADGANNLSIDGRINLSLVNLVVMDTFFSGFADVSIRLLGPNSTARLTGTANVVNGSVATFVGSDRFTLDRVKARVIFTTNQVEIEEASGYLGGGKFVATGGGYLEGLAVKAFRVSLDGSNVTVPLPKDFITTGDAKLEISGIRDSQAESLQMTIGGHVLARRSIYSKDIDLANIVGGRRDANLAAGGSSMNAARFDDLVIEGRDALVVKNNVADLTASVSLVLSGDTSDPHLVGRITASRGTILFRKDRYEVQRAVLEFPPGSAIDPIINLQAESEIAGYQVFVNLAGPLKDSEQLSATVRSSPALPQADVVSLITTGNLANSGGGIPTLAQTGINTAAEILTDTIINNPARKATDRLFGLNVFEIDPLISGQQANPTARLTVGRQINNNLRVTYSTNLSQDQNQILALEYRVSNKLSFVAQYEQRPLSNVTRTRDNFSFEIRFRKRF